MAENLNNTGDERHEMHEHHHHHHHHHHSHSSKDGSSSHHHHHHSSVRIVTGNRLRRIPWIEGISLIVICLALFFIMVMCTKFVS